MIQKKKVRKTLMNKFNIDEFDYNKNYVIEASAGTGKTYNVIEIVKKLVDNDDDKKRKDLSKILIVTYTEKAAGELKNRIMKNVNGANVDNLSIYTIHSFCQMVIKEFGLTANLPLNLKLIEKYELDRYVDQYIREGKILNDISYFLNLGYAINIDTIKDTLKEAIGKFYLNLNNDEDSSVISMRDLGLYQTLFNYIEFFNDSNNAPYTFEKFINNPKNNVFKCHYDNMVGGSQEKSGGFAESVKESFNNNLQYNNTSNKNSFKKIKKELIAYQFFMNLKNGLKDDDSVSKIISKAIAALNLKDFYISWQNEKNSNKNQSFDDMIRYVREAVLKGDLSKELKKKYDIAIIDEFQDTNRLQFDIFKSIFMDETHRIIVVGDPKQSIFSFQGADVNVYGKAVEEIEANNGVKTKLIKNYRSTKEMVESCNQLFNTKDFFGNEFESSEYLTIKKDQSVHEVKYQGRTPKAFWIAQSSEGSTIDEDEFANIVVQKIIDCCTMDENKNTKLRIKDKDDDYRDVSFADFTILVRKRKESDSIIKALKNAGIPYVKYKDNNLFLGKECFDWITLFQAINTIDFTGYNRKKLKKALFTNFFGFTIEELNSELLNKDDLPEIRKINKWKLIASKKRWEDLIDSILMDSKLNENLKTLKELQSLSIYKQIANYCIDYLSNGNSIGDLIRHLTNLSNSGTSNDEDGSTIEKSTNFNCVQIMTMHASKGLQFPVVIGYGGFGSNRTQSKSFTYYDDENKYLVFENYDNVKKASTEEFKRLIYVAYTRAQHIMILPNYKTYTEKFLGLSMKEFINSKTDFYEVITENNVTEADLREQAKQILNKGQDNKDDSSKKDQESNLKYLTDKDVQETKKIFKRSYSSLSHSKINLDLDEIEDLELENKEGIVEIGLSIFDKLGKYIEPSYNETIEPINLPINYPRGAKLGTALHEIFENLDFQNYENKLEEKIKICFSKQGIRFKDEWMEPTKEIVKNVLLAELPIINGANKTNETLQLKDLSFDHKLDEVEFNFNFLDKRLNNYCNGFIDMIFMNGNYYSIVDWKSDRLNEEFDSYSNIKSIKGRVDDSYSIQRVLYSYCLVKWLKASIGLTESEIFEKHFGGIYYIFLRGCVENTGNGVYCQTWNSWDDLEKSFNEIVKIKLGGSK